MRQYPRRNPGLLDRDYEILEHVARYRITTPDALHLLPVFEGVERNAVTKVTSRLCELDFLKKGPLYGSNVYFKLGRHGAQVMGVKPSRVTDEHRPQALYRDFGILGFCCLGPVKRERLKVRELEREHPELLVRGIEPSQYYFEEFQGHRCLGFIWPEAGGEANYVARAVTQKIIEPRRQVTVFRNYIESKQFIVSIVTFSEEKREAIVRALQDSRKGGLARVEVVPELIHLLPARR